MSLKVLAPTYCTRLRETIAEVNRSNHLLNAGCGDGYFDLFLKKKAKKITSFDINKSDLRIARMINPEKRIKYKLLNIESLPFKSNYFDTVVCIDVLEHLNNSQIALKELVRVLKNGGKLIISVPSKDFPFVYDPINYLLNRLFNKRLFIGAWAFGHKRLYTTSKLKKQAIQYKLKTEKIKYLSHFLSGFFENSYINSSLQKFTKSDSKNLDRESSNFQKVKDSVLFEPPNILKLIRDTIINLDNFLFKYSKKSVGIMIIFRKR